MLEIMNYFDNFIIGAVIAPTALFLNAFASFQLPESLQKLSPLIPALQSNWLMMHVTVMLLSYTTLICGCILGITFLFLFERQFENLFNHSNTLVPLSYFAHGRLFNKDKPGSRGRVVHEGTGPTKKQQTDWFVHQVSQRDFIPQYESYLQKSSSQPWHRREQHNWPARFGDARALSNNSQSSSLWPTSRTTGQPGIATRWFLPRRNMSPVVLLPPCTSQMEHRERHDAKSPASYRKPINDGTISMLRCSAAPVHESKETGAEDRKSDLLASSQIQFDLVGRLKLLKNLDQLSFRLIGIGFPFLTIGILSGSVWANEAWGSYWNWDPKETWSLITWLIFAIYLHLRLTQNWNGFKSAILATVGFFSVWICFLGVNFLAKGLHSYGWFHS